MPGTSRDYFLVPASQDVHPPSQEVAANAVCGSSANTTCECPTLCLDISTCLEPPETTFWSLLPRTSIHHPRKLLPTQCVGAVPTPPVSVPPSALTFPHAWNLQRLLFGPCFPGSPSTIPGSCCQRSVWEQCQHHL